MKDFSASDLRRHAEYWGLELEPNILQTASASMVFGWQETQAVVLKVLRDGSDEQRSGLALRHFNGRGAVRCLAQHEDALLLKRVIPGTALTSLVLRGEDDEAMQILCGVIRRLHEQTSIPGGFPTIEDWGGGFRRYCAGAPHPMLPLPLVEQAHHLHETLCASQRRRVLLHGDLHHDNVLFDDKRGWLAIDPKGVVGEPEYEIGAALRNPTLDVNRYADPRIIESRVNIAAREAELDPARMVGWCFAQAVLSSIWAIEDHESEAAIYRGVATARATLPLLSG